MENNWSLTRFGLATNFRYLHEFPFNNPDQTLPLGSLGSQFLGDKRSRFIWFLQHERSPSPPSPSPEEDSPLWQKVAGRSSSLAAVKIRTFMSMSWDPVMERYLSSVQRHRQVLPLLHVPAASGSLRNVHPALCGQGLALPLQGKDVDTWCFRMSDSGWASLECVTPLTLPHPLPLFHLEPMLYFPPGHLNNGRDCRVLCKTELRTDAEQ